MELKRDVEVYGICPELIIAVLVAKDVVNEDGHDFVITSCTERGVKHSRTSLHWSGAALDIRSRELEDDVAVADEIRRRLTHEFDVICEDDHIHIEFQPKGD